MGTGIKNPLKNSVLILFCASVSLTVVTACDGSTEKAQMRKNGNPGGSPGKPTNNEDRTYATEAVASLALLSFSELHRTTDILVHGDKAKSFHKVSQSYKLDKKSQTATNATYNLVTRSSIWSGVEEFQVEIDAQKIVRSAQLSLPDLSVVLKNNKVRELSVNKHDITWTYVDLNKYTYEQIIAVEMEAIKANDSSLKIEILSSGTLFLNAKTGEIEKVQPSKLSVERVLAHRNNTKVAKSSFTFDNLSEKNVVCGRPIGNWSGTQSLEKANADLDDKTDLALTSTSNGVMATKTKRNIRLQNCEPGFGAFETDMATIAAVLQKDLGH